MALMATTSRPQIGVTGPDHTTEAGGLAVQPETAAAARRRAGRPGIPAAGSGGEAAHSSAGHLPRRATGEHPFPGLPLPKHPGILQRDTPGAQHSAPEADL